MPISGGVAVSGIYDAYVCIRDKKTLGTDGGTFTSGAWRTRDINEEQADTAGICAIAANQITLAVGTYTCLIFCPAMGVVRNQAKLYNVTDGVDILMGSVAYVHPSVGGFVESGYAIVAGRFTLAAQKVLEIQHQCEYTCATTGFGAACSFADEIYTVAQFWREG